MVRLETQNISMIFGKTQVLKQIDLKIGAGEIFGLLGPSGAGKTTLIKILTGQLKQTGGKAWINGNDSKSLSSRDYTKIGMVLDNAGLYERLSCYDNLALFAEIYGINKGCIAEALEKTGLQEAAKRPVAKLSKGMKQRLVLARAIMHGPEVLFLDEPTSGLDPVTASNIHKLIREQQAKGTTIFLTTHNMEEAAKLCDHVALLHQGSIVEYGNPQEVCRRYNHLNSLRMLLKNGETVTLKNDTQAADVVADYIRTGSIESIHSTEPNLETVFMELTGRGLEA